MSYKSLILNRYSYIYIGQRKNCMQSIEKQINGIKIEQVKKNSITANKNVKLIE